MTNSQRIALRLSELREKINGFAEDGKAEDLETLRRESTGLESEYRAAIVAEDAENAKTISRASGDGQGAEHRQLMQHASLGNYFNAAINMRAVDGRELELSAASGMDAQSFPAALLTENKAIATITGDVQGNQRPIIDQLFPMSAAAFMHVNAEMVPTGDAVFPVLSTGASVRSPAKGAAAAESTGAFTVTTLNPGRLQAGFSYSYEDAARLAGMDMALRDNLRDALGSELDDKVVSDLISASIEAHPNTPGQETTADEYIAAMFDGVDGIRPAWLPTCGCWWDRVTKAPMVTWRLPNGPLPLTLC